MCGHVSKSLRVQRHVIVTLRQFQISGAFACQHFLSSVNLQIRHRTGCAARAQLGTASAHGNKNVENEVKYRVATPLSDVGRAAPEKQLVVFATSMTPTSRK